MGSNNKKLTSPQKKNIEKLLINGNSHRQIALKLEISVGVVTKIRKTLDVVIPKACKGQKNILSPQKQRAIIRDIRNGKVSNAVEVQKRLSHYDNIRVSAQTVRRVLKNVGMKGRAKIKKPLLTQRHRDLRMSFANKYQKWTEVDWANVIFSDETKINRFGSDGKQWTWRAPGKPLRQQHVQPTLKFG